jgi:cytochrome P450
MFDLRSEMNSYSGGGFIKDPYPRFHELREAGPIHSGTVHELLGWEGPAMFQGLPFPDLEHYSAFSFAACEVAFRDNEIFASSPEPINREDIGIYSSMLGMGGATHRRYRGLVQPSFVPVKARWWIDNWIRSTVDSLVLGLEGQGRAELNVDFCAAIPVLTITGGFGVPVDQALDLRDSVRPGDEHAVTKLIEILSPIVAARREQPQDDLISVLVEAEYRDDDGIVHRLSDAEIYSFSYLLLAAGSGTTWKQMGIALTALLTHPDLLEAAKADPGVLRASIDEALRWCPTDPMFARFVSRDVDFFDATLSAGSVLHLCVAAANRDPARWEDPDRFDPYRTVRSTLAFGSGPHICLGMHVARAEMQTGITELLDRLPNLRLDPDADPPRIIGMYERGPTEIWVRFE